VGGKQHLVAVLPQDLPQAGPGGLLVVGDDDRAAAIAHGPSAPRARPGRAPGSNIRKVVPRPRSLSYDSRPPCASTMPREIGRPSPVPPRFVEVKKLNTSSPGSIPAPVSRTSIAAPSSSGRTATVRTPPC